MKLSYTFHAIFAGIADFVVLNVVVNYLPDPEDIYWSEKSENNFV